MVSLRRTTALLLVMFHASLADAAEISGRTLSANSGEPLTDVQVQLLDPQIGRVDVEVDGTGSWVARDLPAGRWRVRAVPGISTNRAVRYAPQERDFCDGDVFQLDGDTTISGVDVHLPEGKVATGTILSPRELRESLVVWATLSGDDVGRYDRPGVVNGEGRLEIRGLEPEPPPGEWRFYASTEGLPEQWLPGTYTEEEATGWSLPTSGELELGAHTLLPGITVRGRIWGPDGPASEGTVHVYSPSQVVSVPIQPDGTYEADGLPPGEVISWINVPGLAMTYFPDADRPGATFPVLEEGGIGEGVDIRAPWTAIFQARFVSALTGEGIPEVTGLLYNDGRTVGVGDQADESGLLRIDRLHGGPWTLYFWADDQGFTEGWVLDDQGQERVFEIEGEVENPEIELPLSPAARISGRLIDEEGDPLGGMAVVLIGADQVSTGGWSDAQGYFSIGGLQGGDWELSVESAVYCPDDPGWVPIYWPGTVNPDWAEKLTLAAAEQVDGLEIVVPFDGDHDLMGDGWERNNQLDPTRDDSEDDPDGDNLTNLDEYHLGTDPQHASLIDGGCGCSSLPSTRAMFWALGPLVFGLARRRSA
jgi:hypothetical protein